MRQWLTSLVEEMNVQEGPAADVDMLMKQIDEQKVCGGL